MLHDVGQVLYVLSALSRFGPRVKYCTIDPPRSNFAHGAVTVTLSHVMTLKYPKFYLILFLKRRRGGGLQAPPGPSADWAVWCSIVLLCSLLMP